MESKGRRKRLGFQRFLDSFKYSYAGLKYAYKNEQSMLIHLLATIIVIIGGFLLHISVTEWLICIVLFGFVMGAELLNTAIEATVDMAMPDIHPLAKIAKDTASAAVGVLSLAALAVGIIIFLPKILALF